METVHCNEHLKFFLALLAIVNPVGLLPIFINMTASQERAARNRNGTLVTLSMGIILLLVLVSGEAILCFYSFRVGGILVLLITISMLNARVSNVRQTREEELDSAERDSVAVVPLGTPLLAGPGAISTVILYAQRHPSPGLRSCWPWPSLCWWCSPRYCSGWRRPSPRCSAAPASTSLPG